MPLPSRLWPVWACSVSFELAKLSPSKLYWAVEISAQFIDSSYLNVSLHHLTICILEESKYPLATGVPSLRIHFDLAQVQTKLL